MCTNNNDRPSFSVVNRQAARVRSRSATVERPLCHETIWSAIFQHLGTRYWVEKIRFTRRDNIIEIIQTAIKILPHVPMDIRASKKYSIHTRWFD